MIRFCLKSSRPGLWFPTLWLYLLPSSGHDLWTQPPFWVGLIFVTFPLNIMVYGWNDLVDQDIDQYNPRKDTYLFGAKGKSDELQLLPRVIIYCQLMFWPMLLYFSSWWMLITLAGVVFFGWIYNAKHWGLRSKPPLELFCQVGYLLVVPISCLLNGLPFPKLEVWLYLFLFCAQSQLIGEVMDIEPDREGGRKTIATELGRNRTKILIILIVASEAVLIWVWFHDLIFAVGLLFFVIWLLLDRFVLYQDRQYTMREFRIFGVGANIVAVLSMIYVWTSQIFVSSVM